MLCRGLTLHLLKGALSRILCVQLLVARVAVVVCVENEQHVESSQQQQHSRQRAKILQVLAVCVR
jgi:hypothetical protein